MKRLSTNEKLQIALNGPGEDEEERKAREAREKNAFLRVRRTSLYGCGARAKVPKTKKKKITVGGKSPFALADATHLDTSFIQKETTSAPPGAHEEQYRRIQSQTVSGLADADRVFIQPTLIKAGIRLVDQPPWYVGNQNKITPPDNSMINAAARYGYRGAMGIQQYSTQVCENPERTKTPYTPKFLSRNETIADEYAPSIRMEPYNKGYHPNLVSPKLWPESTEFPNGYPKKEQASSVYYSRESTISEVTRPMTTGPAFRVKKKRHQEEQKLRALVFLESTGTILNRPMTLKSTMETTWDSRIKRCGTASLHSSMSSHHAHERQDPHSLMDPTDKMLYSGSSAYIVHSQSTDDLKFKHMMDKIYQSSNYPLRWRQVSIQMQHLSRRKRRDQTIADLIMNIAIALRREAAVKGNETQINRLDFITAMQNTTQFEQVPESQLSLLFSTFDNYKRNRIRYADILAGMTILDRPQDSCIEKLCNVWTIYDEFGNDIPRLDMILTILKSCANSDENVNEVEHEFKLHFRPLCYKEALHANSNPSKSLSNEIQSMNRSILNGKGKPSYYSVLDTLVDKVAGLVHLLERSPRILQMVDDQLSERLIAFYGKDTRRVPKELSEPHVSSSIAHMFDH